MSGNLSDYSVGKWLDHLLRGTAYSPPATVYVALATASFGDDNSGIGNEIADAGAYARVAATFAAAGSRAVVTSVATTWSAPTGDWGTVAYWGVFDSGVHGAGNLLGHGQFDNALAVNNGDGAFSIDAGDLSITIAAGAISDYAVHKMLDLMFRDQAYSSPATVYLAGYTAAPTDSDTGTEVVDATAPYARQATAFDAVASRATQNTLDETFPKAEEAYGLVGFLGIRDALTAGNLLWHWTLTTGDTGEERRIKVSDSLIVESGELVASIAAT